MNTSCFAVLGDSLERLSSAAHILLCLDIEKSLFAGDTPVRLGEPGLSQLRHLANNARLTLVIFSSRSRAELQAQVGLAGVVYVGNLGLEISGDGFLMVEPAAAGYSEEIARTAARLTAKLATFPGARVEDKGLTIRVTAPVADTSATPLLAPGPAAPAAPAASADEQLRQAIHETLASANHPFHLVRREHLYEIRPRVPWTKFDAIKWIKERLRQPEALVLYLTDDEKDTGMVAALGGVGPKAADSVGQTFQPDSQAGTTNRQAGKPDLQGNAITIQVGGPPETMAHCRLEGAAEIWLFLSELENLLTADAVAMR